MVLHSWSGCSALPAVESAVRTRGPTSEQLNSWGKPGVLERVLKSTPQADTAMTRSSRAKACNCPSSSLGSPQTCARDCLALVSARCARELTSRSNHSRTVVSTTPDAAHVRSAKPMIKASITCAIRGISVSEYACLNALVETRILKILDLLRTAIVRAYHCRLVRRAPGGWSLANIGSASRR